MKTETHEKLNTVKTRLDLSLTQLAELLNISRKSIYDWYDGEEPSDTILARLEIIANLPGDLSRLKMVWHIPVSGESFLSVFHEGESITEKLVELEPYLAEKPKIKSARIYLGEAHMAEFQ